MLLLAPRAHWLDFRLWRTSLVGFIVIHADGYVMQERLLEISS